MSYKLVIKNMTMNICNNKILNKITQNKELQSCKMKMKT